jgi:hypothetical protein
MDSVQRTSGDFVFLVEGVPAWPHAASGHRLPRLRLRPQPPDLQQFPAALPLRRCWASGR